MNAKVSLKTLKQIAAPWHHMKITKALSSVAKETSKETAVVIPKRIPRTATSILEALASTVNYDATAYHYRIIDDPATLPAHIIDDRHFVLSEKSGRATAEDFVQKFPKLFQLDTSSLTSEAFTPKQLKHLDDTEDSLLERISMDLVQEAKNVYEKIIAAGTELSPDTKLKYLDLLCRMNCNDPEPQNLSRDFFFPDSSERSKPWRPEPVVDQLFSSLNEKYPQAYISLILGMIKYGDLVGAYDKYKKALQDGILLPVEVHNHILSTSVPRLSEFDAVWAEIRSILTYMEEHKIRPTLDTFNRVLSQIGTLPGFTPRYEYGRQIIKEMKECKIEPSMGSYAHLLNMVYRTKYDRKSDLLKAVLKEVTKKSDHLDYRHRDDTRFLETAMFVASKCNDVETAHHVYELAYKGLNKQLLGDSRNQYSFGNNYLTLVMRSEPMDKIMDVYAKIVPRVFIPLAATYKALLDIVELYEGHKYLPQIYQDTKMAKRFGDQNLLEKISFVMASKNIKDDLLDSMMIIAEDIFESWNDEVASRKSSFFELTPTIFSNFIHLSLNKSDVDKAIFWFQKYKEIAHSKQGMTNSEALSRLCEALLNISNEELTLEVFYVMRDLKFEDAIVGVLDSSTKELSESFREQVKGVVASKDHHKKMVKKS